MSRSRLVIDRSLAAPAYSAPTGRAPALGYRVEIDCEELWRELSSARPEGAERRSGRGDVPGDEQEPS